MISKSGNASFSPDESWLLVDNLASYDLYRYPRTSPSDTFSVPRVDTYTHEATFIENGSLVICGSDHGTVYVFCLDTTKTVQKLKHGGKKTMIQAVDVRVPCSYF